MCQSHIRKFLAAGVIPRSDACCPICGSLERHRLDWLFFQDNTNLLDRVPKRMLHVAPEAGLKSQFRHIPNLEYFTGDLSNPDAMIKMDVTDIPFPNNSVDVIYCSHVLEHVPNDLQAMREFCRILHTDGWAVLQVPITVAKTIEASSVTKPEDRQRLFGQHDHVRSYGSDYKDRLENAGFLVTIFPAVEIVGIHDCLRMGIPHDQEIVFCKKKS